MTRRFGRRTKAALIALVFMAAMTTARNVMADDLDWLRIVCSPWPRHSIMWELLGCYQLPDDVHSPQG